MSKAVYHPKTPTQGQRHRLLLVSVFSSPMEI